MDREAASRHRQHLNSLRQQRDAIEEDLLEARELLRGSLVAHTILAGGYRRRQPAFYLARRDSGRRRMVYIHRADLERTRRQVEAGRRYVDSLRRLRILGRKILEAFQALRESADVLDSK
jgi:hypothetical protein